MAWPQLISQLKNIQVETISSGWFHGISHISIEQRICISWLICCGWWNIQIYLTKPMGKPFCSTTQWSSHLGWFCWKPIEWSPKWSTLSSANLAFDFFFSNLWIFAEMISYISFVLFQNRKKYRSLILIVRSVSVSAIVLMIFHSILFGCAFF